MYRCNSLLVIIFTLEAVFSIIICIVLYRLETDDANRGFDPVMHFKPQRLGGALIKEGEKGGSRHIPSECGCV